MSDDPGIIGLNAVPDPDLAFEPDLGLQGIESMLPDHQKMTEFPWARGLTWKQQKLVAMYDGTNLGRCAIELQVKVDAVRRWLQDPRIRYALSSRSEHCAAPEMVASREERLTMWTAIMRDEGRSLEERMKASELLGKANCDFSERRILAGDATAPLYVIETGVPRTPGAEAIDVTPTPVEDPFDV